MRTTALSPHTGPRRTKAAFLFLIIFLATVTAARPAQARTYKAVYSFSGSDGSDPEGDLILDQDGNLYGTTYSGGTSNDGTVFKIDANRNETVLYNFDYTSGAAPFAGLVMDSVGNLYGTTSGGGSNACLPGGCGVVFKIDAAGVYTTLHLFTEGDGSTPLSTPILDAAGNLYGTTRFGGAFSRGTVFKLDPLGNLTTLYSFAGGDDGESPFAGLVADAAGNLYGTTRFGGGPFNFGTVYKIDSSGIETVLFRFAHFADGNNPNASLILDDAGNLYGTTIAGGTNGGTVFKVDPTGNETVLHAFRSADGKAAWGKLIRDSAGNLYGTTRQGGAVGHGTVFRLESSGRLRLLHSFVASKDRGFPDTGLVRDKAGNLYGTSSRGGANRKGSVFRISK